MESTLPMEAPGMYGFVSDVLNDKGHHVYTVGPLATVREAAREMNAHGVGGLLVIAHGMPVGIFTERDILKRVVDPGASPDTTRVADVMTAELHAVTPGTRVDEAMALMTHARCRHLPVMDEGALVGLVSIGDLTRWVTLNLEGEVQHLVDYITGRHPA